MEIINVCEREFVITCSPGLRKMSFGNENVFQREGFFIKVSIHFVRIECGDRRLKFLLKLRGCKRRKTVFKAKHLFLRI